MATPVKLDKGQERLLAHLKAFIAEVEQGEFGDFTNEKYPDPKSVLAGVFQAFRENVINGEYDA